MTEELNNGASDNDVLDVLFDDELSDLSDEDLGLDDDIVKDPVSEKQPPAPDIEPPEQNTIPNASEELQYYKEKNELLTNQIAEVGLVPDMTNSERIQKLAAGGMNSEYARELMDNFALSMSESSAEAMVAQLVDDARAKMPNIQHDGENNVNYMLRTTPELADLNKWFTSGDPKFEQAQQLDEQALNLPQFKEMSEKQRFKVVQDMINQGKTSFDEPSSETAVVHQQSIDPDNFDRMSNDDIEAELEKYSEFL